nr:protein phosphatase 2C 37-like [Tanacetum cinerariifolium]
MAGMCCGVVGETKTPTTVEHKNGRQRRRMDMDMDIRQLKRRDLEDAVAVKPAFVNRDQDDLHFYGVYDGHGCSHVAMKCKDRMHEIVKEEVEKNEDEEMKWKETMVKSFSRMDKDVTEWSSLASSSNCRCELQTPQRRDLEDAVAVKPAFVNRDQEDLHFYGVYDGHGCSHVAMKCKDSMHEIVKEEVEKNEEQEMKWKETMPYVIPEPEVTVTERTAEDECLILASDGLWDVVSNDVACSVARMCLKSQEVPSPPRSPGSEMNVARGESSDKACSDASTLLTKLALARRSTDNVSVVVVDLRRNYND